MYDDSGYTSLRHEVVFTPRELEKYVVVNDHYLRRHGNGMWTCLRRYRDIAESMISSGDCDTIPFILVVES